MNKDLAVKCLELELQDYNQTEIGKKLNVSQVTVGRQLRKIKNSRQHQMGYVVMTDYLNTFKKCEQYWAQSNHDYEQMICEVEALEETDDVDSKGRIHKSKHDKKIEKIELIKKIKDKKDKNMERILSLASQGDLVKAIQYSRDILAKYSPDKPFVLGKPMPTEPFILKKSGDV